MKRKLMEFINFYDEKKATLQRILERLEALKMQYFLTIANTGNEKLDFAYEKAGNAIDKAIEIVREEGGLNV